MLCNSLIISPTAKNNIPLTKPEAIMKTPISATILIPVKRLNIIIPIPNALKVGVK